MCCALSKAISFVLTMLLVGRFVLTRLCAGACQSLAYLTSQARYLADAAPKAMSNGCQRRCKLILHPHAHIGIEYAATPPTHSPTAAAAVHAHDAPATQMAIRAPLYPRIRLIARASGHIAQQQNTDAEHGYNAHMRAHTTAGLVSTRVSTLLWASMRAVIIGPNNGPNFPYLSSVYAATTSVRSTRTLHSNCRRCNTCMGQGNTTRTHLGNVRTQTANNN